MILKLGSILNGKPQSPLSMGSDRLKYDLSQYTSGR